MSKTKKSLNYIDNVKLYQYFVDWKNSGDEKIPNNIAKAILEICENLSKSGKFVGYTWRSEMMEDGLLCCIRFCRNFDPQKSKNPFAYLTQIAYNAFIKRIGIEKQRLETISNYREHISELYDIPPEELTGEEDEKYQSIDNVAKSINRTFTKKPKVKKKKESKEITNSVELFF